jgi:hypothetical protein
MVVRGEVRNKVFYIFYANGGKWRQETYTGSFGNLSPVFPHSFQLLQALVITYDDIFQSLSVEGDVLLPKPFLDPPIPTLPTVELRVGPFVLSRVWQTENSSPRQAISFWWHSQSRGPEMASGAGHLLLPPGIGKCHRILSQVYEQVWKLYGKTEDWRPKISICFSCLHLPLFT